MTLAAQNMTAAHHLVCLRRAAEYVHTLPTVIERDFAYRVLGWLELYERSYEKYYVLKQHVGISGARAQEILQEMRCLLGRIVEGREVHD